MPRYDRYRYSTESTARQPEPEFRPRPPRRKPRPTQKKKAKKKSFFKASNAQYIYEDKKNWLRLPMQVIATSMVVFACAMIIVLFNGQITGTERELTVANSDLRALQETNRNLESQIGGNYTLEEIEFYAFTQLGMTLPDPAQVIEINIPRQSHAMLSTQEFLPPAENFLWQDVSTFVRGLFNRLFG